MLSPVQDRKMLAALLAKDRGRQLAILCDHPEEGWPSMDLVAEMLSSELKKRRVTTASLTAECICPQFRPRAIHMPRLSGNTARNVDRLINRLWDYPNYARRMAKQFDLFHVVDHSYSQLVHKLPANLTGVYCHDLDTFRCILQPDCEPRPRWFRMMARHILRGMQKAAIVFYSTNFVRDQILHYDLLDPVRLVHAPFGISPEFGLGHDPASEAQAAALVGTRPFLLHVGSCIARKRIDVLLDVFANVRLRSPDLRLVKVGGEWTDSHISQIGRLGIESTIVHVRNVSRGLIASLYRRAALVMQTSDAEGFGFPVIEALACGATLVASDIPPLREVGGDAAHFCPVGNVGAWAETIELLLKNPARPPSVALRLAQAKKYSWAEHARIISESYLRLARGESVLDPTAAARINASSDLVHAGRTGRAECV